MESLVGGAVKPGGEDAIAVAAVADGLHLRNPLLSLTLSVNPALLYVLGLAIYLKC